MIHLVCSFGKENMKRLEVRPSREKMVITQLICQGNVKIKAITTIVAA